MLSEKIKEHRKKNCLSQEELALKLHIVRQTVSKWENGLSVPDAIQLIELAKIFDVSVSELLDVEVQDETNTTEIAKELERANAQIAELLEKEKQWKEANRVRGIILFLSFLAVMVSVAVKQEMAAMICTAVLLIMILCILYRHLGILTIITIKDIRLKSLQLTTIFNIGMIALAMGGALLLETGVITAGEQQEKYFSGFLVAAIMFFAGYISPKLPFNRHTGLRLPWTVQDEETWNVAHQILGIIGVPLGIVYLTLLFLVEDFELLTVALVLLLVGIPGVLSCYYYWKKYHRL